MAGSDTSREDDVVADAHEAYEADREAFDDNYRAALDDFRFARLHEHWPAVIKRQRELDNRPCLTIPRLPAFIRQVVNDARQNKPAITVHPVDSASDPETAEIFTGLIRHIEQSSDADVSYDTSLECAVTGGFGYFTINTRYTTDDGFEQDICIEPVPNPFSIIPPADSTAADSSDWNRAFILTSQSRAQFKDRWGKDAEPVSFGDRGVDKTPVKDGENVVTAAMWSREQSTRTIVALSPGNLSDPTADPNAVWQAMQLMGERMVVDMEVYQANKDLFDALGVQIVGQPRDVPTFKVSQQILSGCDVLETNPWAGKWIPIVPVYGEDLNIEGKRHLSGLVRPAKDSQRNFNYWRTAATELVALAPKAPFIGPVGAFATDAAKWATANTDTHAYIEYDQVGPTGAPIPPPQRQPFAGMPAGALQEAMNASDDMKSIMGLHDASLGARSNETSGVAIMARQREGDVSSFHFIDNLSRSIRHAGRIILDLIPHVYSTPRMIRILGPDGEAKGVQIGPAQPGMPPEAQETMGDEAKELSRVFDLTVGKYDLTVTAGPSFTSRREEAATQMIELIRAYPPVAPIIGDLLARNLDWPGADEIADRLEKMLPAQLQGNSPEAQQAQAQMQQMAQIIGQLKGQLAAANADKSLDAKRVEIEAFDAETARLKALAPKGVVMNDPNDIQALVVKTLQDALRDPEAFLQANPQLMAPQAPDDDEGGGGPMSPPLAA